MSPYLELTEFSEVVNKLAVKSNDSGFEVRCIMPRFGAINERRHRLHEVVRLSGINVSIDNEDFPLQIKVATIEHRSSKMARVKRVSNRKKNGYRYEYPIKAISMLTFIKPRSRCRTLRGRRQEDTL